MTLNINLCGSLLLHNYNPQYLGITLAHTLSFHRHLEEIKRKTKTKVNIIQKLTGTSWGSNVCTVQISTLIWVHSTVESCALVWSGRPKIILVDTKINTTLDENTSPPWPRTPPSPLTKIKTTLLVSCLSPPCRRWCSQKMVWTLCGCWCTKQKSNRWPKNLMMCKSQASSLQGTYGQL